MQNIIKVDFQEVRFSGMTGIEMTQNRDSCWALTNAEMNFRLQ